MNWFMVAVGGMQLLAAGWSFVGGDWRLGVMNVCVGIANIVIAGAKG